MQMIYQENAREHALVRLTKGFLFIPICITLLGAMLAFAAFLIDDMGLMDGAFKLFSYDTISVDGARSVLSTIAGAMMSVISLVYSLTLVVFTLAAGNISARLLETFASNRTTQITIGLLGATFLYSMIALFGVDENEDLRFSVILCIILASASFFWLVYFVNDVAGRIRVDAEIGRIHSSLRFSIDDLLTNEPREQPNDCNEIPDLPIWIYNATYSGYITFIDSNQLIEIAKSLDGFIEVTVSPGTYVIEGMPIAKVRTAEEEPDLKRLEKTFQIEKARAPEGDIQFSVHLMVEIALRALSPGVNDSYTAISAIDHLSASVARILQRGAPSSLITDDEDTPRLWLTILEMHDLLDTAVGPLRQAARGNVLVLHHFISALEKASLVCRKEHLPLVSTQLFNIAQDAVFSIEGKPDRQQIARKLWAARKTLHEQEKAG
jgi:uncharacterized membrane protein